MLPTSQAYKEAVVKSTRSSVASIYFGIYDVSIKDGAIASSPASMAFSPPSKVLDNVLAPEFAMGSYEVDYFKLDGSMTLVPDDISASYSLGWWSSTISREDCTFAVGEIPTLYVDFSQPISSKGVELYFDTKGGSYPQDFEISWYDGAVLLDSQVVTGNTALEYRVVNEVLNYDSIVIAFTKTDAPFRRARMIEINFGLGELLDSADIVRASLVEEVDPISGSLSMNKLSITLMNTDQRFNMINPEGIYAYLQRRQQIIAKSGLTLADGSIEHIPMGVYYLSNWKNATGLTATLEATDVFGFMDKTTYYKSPFWDDVSARIVVADILADAGNFPFSLSSEVAQETITGYIPVTSHREALQMVLIALRATVRYDRSGMIVIFRPNYNAVQKEIGNDTLIGGTPQPEQKPLISAVAATDYIYKLDELTSTLHESTVTVNGSQQFTFQYDTAASDILISVLGGTLVESTAHATNAFALISAAGEVTVTITGKKYIESKNIVTSSLSTMPSGEIPQTATLADNKLLSGIGKTRLVTDYFLEYYQKRIKQVFNYWDDPAVQAGDNVGVETMFGTTQIGLIESQEIQFAPSLKAKVEATG